MAMTMTGEVKLAAPREVVWEKLNDPEVLKACIPGCESLDMLSDHEFQAVATNKIGPVKARFKGKVRLSDLDPPNGYRISGEGDGGVAGLRQGRRDRQARVGRGGGTMLKYSSRGADRRQARAARPAPGQRRGQEARRPVLREIRRGGGQAVELGARHCEPKAKQSRTLPHLDCFVAALLAMTDLVARKPGEGARK